MSRIKNCFTALQAKGRKALIPYVTAGDPAPEVTLPLMHDLVAAGADIIELGIPFSDPMYIEPMCVAPIGITVKISKIIINRYVYGGLFIK